MGIVNACKGCGAIKLHGGLNQAGNVMQLNRKRSLYTQQLHATNTLVYPPTSLGRQR